MRLQILVAIFCFFAVSDSLTQNRQEAIPFSIESMTLTANGTKISMVVWQGKLVDKKFQPNPKPDKYEIDFLADTIKVNNEPYELDEYEGVLVYRQVELVYKYGADSVSWWNMKKKEQRKLVVAN